MWRQQNRCINRLRAMWRAPAVSRVGCRLASSIARAGLAGCSEIGCPLVSPVVPDGQLRKISDGRPARAALLMNLLPTYPACLLQRIHWPNRISGALYGEFTSL